MKSILHMHNSYVCTAAVTLHCIFFQHSTQSGISQCPERWQNMCLPYISFPLLLLNLFKYNFVCHNFHRTMRYRYLWRQIASHSEIGVMQFSSIPIASVRGTVAGNYPPTIMVLTGVWQIWNSGFSMFHCAFFNLTIDEYQHMHFFTFNTVLV